MLSALYLRTSILSRTCQAVRGLAGAQSLQSGTQSSPWGQLGKDAKAGRQGGKTGSSAHPLEDARRRPRRQPWRDRFGTLSPPDALASHEQDRDATDLADGDEEEAYQAKVDDSTRPSRAHFNAKIVRLLREGDLHGALRVLDVEMREEERSPLAGHYRPLINACGREGYHRKAFQLYKEYVDRQLKPYQTIYADLFNSCANSPFPVEALEKARYLRRRLIHLGTPLHQVVYHNMLKAFGRCGDLDTAFLLVDEMKEKHVPITGDTFCHLLQGCISDRETGFRHAIMVWRVMLTRPTAVIGEVHFQQLLRAARDCGAGDVDFYRDILLACMSVSQARRHGQMLLEALEPRTPLPEANPGPEGQAQTVKGTFVKEASMASLLPEGMVELIPDEEKCERLKKNDILPGHGAKLPSVLDRKPDFSGVVSIASLDRPDQRLALLGGPSGVCEALRRRGMQPDAKMFGFMMDMMGDTEEAEAALLAFMDREGVKPDTIMINMLIKRRALRKEPKLGLSTVELFAKYGAQPDIITFGVLALCCMCKREARQLLDDMRGQGFSPNAAVFRSFFSVACARFDANMATFLLRKMRAGGVRPTKPILKKLEEFNLKYREFVVKLERDSTAEGGKVDPSKSVMVRLGDGSTAKVPTLIMLDRGRDFAGWRDFREAYREWLSSTELDASADAHPWRQYVNEREEQKAAQGDREVLKILEEDGAAVT